MNAYSLAAWVVVAAMFVLVLGVLAALAPYLAQALTLSIP